MECYTCFSVITGDNKEVYCDECGRSGCLKCMPFDDNYHRNFCPPEIENHSSNTCLENYTLIAVLKKIKTINDITELELDELLVLAKEYGVDADTSQWLDDDYPDKTDELAVTCMLKYEKLLCKAREDTE